MVNASEQADLVLELIVAPSGAIGYAMVFGCDVRRVLKGRCTATEFELTVLGPDNGIAEMLATRGPSDVVEAGFVKHRSGEPYAVMPITGFVDDRRTSWKLVYLR